MDWNSYNSHDTEAHDETVFTRDALQAALLRLKEEELERRHRAGYERKPVEPGELSDWEDEQVWGD